MKILVYGAGVIGSLYAAKLQRSGETVAVLARGKRLEDLRTRGLEIEDARTGTRTQAAVDVVERLRPADFYDLVVVAVRAHQVDSVLSALAANCEVRKFLFMVNTAAGYDAWTDAVGPTRVALAFPGAGGGFEGSVVRYTIVPRFMQPTTFGEPEGPPTVPLRDVAARFRRAGFPVAFSPRMDAWQKYHAAWIVPVAAAVLMAGGDAATLADRTDTLRLLVRAVREGFAVLRALDYPVTPPKLRAWEWMPEPAMVALLRRIYRSKFAESAVAAHAGAARDEMRVLSAQLLALGRRAGVPTPALDAMNVCMG